jgi:hypothetical protein
MSAADEGDQHPRRTKSTTRRRATRTTLTSQNTPLTPIRATVTALCPLPLLLRSRVHPLHLPSACLTASARRQRKAQTVQRATVRSRLGGHGPSALAGRLGPLGCAPGHFANQFPNRAQPTPPPGPHAAASFGVGTDWASIVQSLYHLLSLGYALGQPEPAPPRFHAG